MKRSRFKFTFALALSLTAVGCGHRAPAPEGESAAAQDGAANTDLIPEASTEFPRPASGAEYYAYVVEGAESPESAPIDPIRSASAMEVSPVAEPVARVDLPPADAPNAVVAANHSEALIPETTAVAPETTAVAPETTAVAEVPAPDDHAEPTPAAADEKWAHHIAGQSDTLMKIAYQYYGDIWRWKEVLEDNRARLGSSGNIRRGMRIRVRVSEQSRSIAGEDSLLYTIKWGDTLGAISRELYETTRYWTHLWKYNERMIRDPNRIFAGFAISYLPKEVLTAGGETKRGLRDRGRALQLLHQEGESIQDPGERAPSSVEDPRESSEAPTESPDRRQETGGKSHGEFALDHR